MTQASLSIQVLPQVNSKKKLLFIVDKAIKIITDSGLQFEVGPMETTVEGDLNKLLNIIEKIQYECIRNGAESLMTYIKINYSPKGIMTINEKISKYKK